MLKDPFEELLKKQRQETMTRMGITKKVIRRIKKVQNQNNMKLVYKTLRKQFKKKFLRN